MFEILETKEPAGVTTLVSLVSLLGRVRVSIASVGGAKLLLAMVMKMYSC